MAIELTTGFAGGALTKTTAVTGISGAASASICCWYYADSFATASNFVLRLTGPGAADTMCQLYTFTDGSFNWSSDDGVFENLIQQAVVLGQWHHYAVTYTQTGITAYYDGVAIGSAAHTFGARASQTQIVVGRCQGKVQDVLVYADALSGSDILEIYRARPPRRMTDLVAWYPLWSGARTIDYGPNSLTFTETGTINDSLTSAPAPWRGPVQNSALRVFAGINAATATGLTRTTGAASAGLTAAQTAAGLAQTTGAATPGLSTLAVGTTQTTGAAVAQFSKALTAAGLTQTSGNAAVSSVAQTAAGLTQTSGVANGASSAAATGPPLGGRQSVSSRRWLGATKSRRAARR